MSLNTVHEPLHSPNEGYAVLNIVEDRSVACSNLKKDDNSHQKDDNNEEPASTYVHDTMSNVSVAEASTTEQINLALLPPLPSPDFKTQIKESSIGVIAAITIIVPVVSLVHSIYQKSGMRFWWIPVTLVYVEVFLVMVCLFGILHTDPGFIQRSIDTCHPIPETVCELLMDPEWDPNSLRSNIVSDVDGRAYCVRCFVWRPVWAPIATENITPIGNELLQKNRNVRNFSTPCTQSLGGNSVHHCSICQRCVLDFDHHCGVFGRCIAARNMPYFLGIIGTSAALTLTCILSMLVIFTQRWGWRFILILVGLCFSMLCCLRELRFQLLKLFYFCLNIFRRLSCLR